MQNIHPGKNDPTTSIDGALEHPVQITSARPGSHFFTSSKTRILFYPYGFVTAG